MRDVRYDKINGNPNRGMEGKEEEERWERDLMISDVWRDRNEGVIATTWTLSDEKKKINGKRENED